MNTESRPNFIDHQPPPQRDFGRRHSLAHEVFELTDEERFQMDYFGLNVAEDTATPPAAEVVHANEPPTVVDTTRKSSDTTALRQLHDMTPSERQRIIEATRYATFSTPWPPDKDVSDQR
ncbi:MAG TPA: hypothetical protein VFL85_05015 [Candidatus Saccharimonadales bacterium]|nr:hypothetical protein [Candidatus Saccharimonadales bacterium]